MPRRRPEAKNKEPDPKLVAMGERLARVAASVFKNSSAAARAFGTTPQSWSNYETGKRPIPMKLLIWLSTKHDVPADFILVGKPTAQLGAGVAQDVLGAEIKEFPALRKQAGR